MKTYEKNMADQALIVKSLKVLENIEGGGVTEIRKDVQAIRQQQASQNKRQDAYWEALSSDGIVSAVEKQGLLREIENITRSEAAILAQAAALGYQGRILQDFIDTYQDLHDYLYITLKLFDNMNEETAIDDRDTFNTKFSQYYFEENFVLLAITAGILDTINFRVLQSLSESGTEGETAIYRGGLYQYVNGAWKNVSTGAYKGPRNELPESEEGAFFIVSESFTMTDVLYVNDEELYVNGDTLGITHTYLKGIIYYCKEGVWYVEENESDWKYAAAFADVINITGELPGIFQDAIDNLQNQIDRIPSYLGASATIPSSPSNGDCFCYIGSTSGTWIKSMLYRYENNAWQLLDPEDTANRQFYMLALEDILASQVAGPGYFSTIFASAFFANSASLQSLSTKTIYLSEGGYIQSEHTQYSPNQQGLRIDSDGNIDANGNTHIGGNLNVTGNGTIGGNVSFGGVLDGATGTFDGGGTFRGNLYCNYSEEIGTYIFSVHDRSCVIHGRNICYGIWEVEGLLNYGIRTINGGYRAFHPTDMNSLFAMQNLIINNLNMYINLAGASFYNWYFRNDVYQQFTANGEIHVTIQQPALAFTLKVTAVGVYRTNDSWANWMGIIYGYYAGNSYRIFWSVPEQRFQLYQYQKSGSAGMDQDTTTLIGTITALGDATIYLN